MALTADQPTTQHDRGGRTETDANARPHPQRTRIDVTGVPADRLPGIVDSAADGERVSLERRGPRTYLLVDR